MGAARVSEQLVFVVDASWAWFEAVLAEVGDKMELNVTVFVNIVVKINEIR